MTTRVSTKPLDRTDAAGISEGLLREMYVSMLRIRKAEDAIADLVKAGEIKCPCHLYSGQEAVAVGVCSALQKHDTVFSTHRSHGHYLAKGGGIFPMMGEIFCRESGCSKGHGGSMHLVAPQVGFPGSSAIVGGTIPIAVGSALSFTLQGLDNVSVAFFGDGAATTGVLYESLNLAALKNLPVIFVCENNFYSTHMSISAIQSNVEIYKKAETFNLPSLRVDGNNVLEVYKAAAEAVDRARRAEGPTFLECITYRLRGHVGPNDDVGAKLRSREELDWWTRNCSIKKMQEALISMELLDSTQVNRISDELDAEIHEAVNAARHSPLPRPADNNCRVYK